MHKMLSVLAVLFSLSACGGGGNPPTVDNSQAITDAAKGVGSKYPNPVPAYSGGFFAVNGVAAGYVSGTSEEKIVSLMAAAIVKDGAINYPDWYKLLLSDAGLDITAFGAQIGVGTVSGLPLMAPDHVYNFKLKSDGTLAVTMTIKG